MLLKIITVLVLGLLTAILARKLFEQMAAARARVRVRARRSTHAVTRLRRDPETGIYHPEA
jgi:hypothetical protein